MTGFDQRRVQAPELADGGWHVHDSPFNREAMTVWEAQEPRLGNWPVVYLIDGTGRRIYVGETLHATSRMRQHLDNPDREGLKHVRVVVDPTFNKSAALDFESRLIQWVHADGRYVVDNRNSGIVDADYHGRDWYRQRFEDIVESLKAYDGGALLRSSIDQLENSDLFKLSPFKTPTDDQYRAIELIISQMLAAMREERVVTEATAGTGLAAARPRSPFVVRGEPGTGKTIVAIYLIKLLVDISRHGGDEAYLEKGDETTGLDSFFTAANESLLAGLRVGFVIPQQSLRESVKQVFKRTAGLSRSMVLSPMEVGTAQEDFDLLVVDEAHRLSRYAAQSMGTVTKRFKEVHAELFGADDRDHTQLDWVMARSRFQLFLVDPEQAVRTSDVPIEALQELVAGARREHRYSELSTQMRVVGGQDYIREIKNALAGRPVVMTSFGDYDFRVYDDAEDMHQAILRREAEHGLARMVAGYAWEWRSRPTAKNPHPDPYDIVIGRFAMPWNSTTKDWIASEHSVDEVGSIHTVQGYDLNYAGVIIGADLRYDPTTRMTFFDRNQYADRRASSNNGMLGIEFTDDDLLDYVRNIYAVLMTRGMRGTYVYAVDEPLREHLKELFPRAIQVASRSHADA
ncbi:DUF2075 domain-containing protein [Actinomyces radicidentis]|uniref:DUF2075 domain-containing protein n=1 Tax=Actinomyces radicidentis TaxID=111015 RepID=UPI0026DEF415|nr:DUF2075 domain-containing protein [Actinomyces radicidentis]